MYLCAYYVITIYMLLIYIKYLCSVYLSCHCLLIFFCMRPYREGHVSALNWAQNRAAKFANNINESGWETLAQRRLIARICALFKAYTGRRTWKAIGDTAKAMLPEFGRS